MKHKTMSAKESSRIKVIIFDCDGVLLESVEIKGEVFRRLGQRLGPEAGEGLWAYDRRHGGVNRREKFAWCFEQFAGRPISDEEMEQWSQDFRQMTIEKLLDCPLTPGALETLKSWRGRLPLYVASGSTEDDLRLVLERRGLAEYFAGIYGYPPSKEEILRKILALEDVGPEKALMVGDSSTDLEAAEAVGLDFYGRGDFQGSGWPSHGDLTRLNEFLEEVASVG